MSSSSCVAIWAEVDEMAPIETRTFTALEDGEIVATSLRWIETIQAGEMTWHLFEVP